MKSRSPANESPWRDLPSPSLLESSRRAAKERAVSARDALEALRHDRALSRAMMRVPLPMIYFSLFVVVAFAHVPSSKLYEQNNALYSTLASSGDATVTTESPMTFENIATPSDVFDWLELTFAPSVFVTQDYNGDDLPEDEWGRVATFNQVLGAVRFKATYSAEQTCSNQEFLNTIYSTCYDSDASSSTVSLLRTSLNTTEAVSAIEELKVSGDWINASTQSLQVSVVTFNGEISSYGVTTLTLEFQEGGFIDLDGYTISAKSTQYKGARPYVADVLFDVCFIFVLCRQIRDLWRNRVRMSAHISTFWHLIDYTSTLLVVAFYAIWGVVVATTHASSFRDSVKALSSTTEDWEANSAGEKDLEVLINTLSRIAHYTVALRLLVSCIIFVLAIRILHRFRFHPRLNVLSKTIANSMSKFGAFLVVCCIVIMTFALSGHIIFGDRAAEFSTVKVSLESCVNILFGNFDYSVIQGLYVPVSIIYYWLYIIVGSLLLLNMMLAIVLDAYEEVSEQAFNDTTITSMSRIVYILIHDAMMRIYDLFCCRGNRLSLELADNVGGCGLTRREIIFRGRIRPDVLEGVLDRLVQAEDYEKLEILTPQSLRSLFSNATVTEDEARATLAYLAHGLTAQSGGEDEDEEEEEETELGMSRKERKKQPRQRLADNTAMLAPSSANGDPWETFVGSEVQSLSQRMALLEQKLERMGELERKLDLMMAHVMRH